MPVCGHPLVRLASVALVIALTAGPAKAAPPTAAQLREAKALHDRALKDYNLGRFPDAIVGFSRAYEIAEDPVLLVNIGQAHRRNGDLERAVFFYKRYLAMSPAAKNRAEVRARIEDMEAILAAPRAPVAPPPAAPPPPVVTKTEVAVPAPRLTSISVDAGLHAFRVAVRRAPRAWEQPTAGVLRVGLARRFAALGERLEVGLSAVLSPISYWDQRTARTAGSLVSGALAGARVLQPLAPLWRAAGELGGGVLLWTGLGAGNPLTGMDEGAVALPAAYAALSGERLLPGGFSVRARLGYTRGLLGGGALAAAATALSQWEMAVGVAYAF